MGDSDRSVIGYVQSMVAAVKGLAHDEEKAHAAEDDLYREVLQHFAAHAPEPFRQIAAEALKTQRIKFARHCA